MKARPIADGVSLVGAIDWDRRLFDSLIPLPDGTSYNAYLVTGSRKTALLDTVEPEKWGTLERQLAGVDRLDYVVCHHVEQDHSGSLPLVLQRYPECRVLTSELAKPMLVDHLGMGEDRIDTVKDGEEVSLGDLTLRFLATPWAHWPETICTWLPERKILFSCDLFGSHLATSEVWARDMSTVMEAAKRYFAEIMMPFRKVLIKNIAKLSALPIEAIAPSHGPLYDHPSVIMDAYREWLSGPPRNLVVVPYISMHGSTRMMVHHLVEALVERGVQVQQFDLAGTDIGKMAMAMVDAATLIVATPTVHGGPHPNVFYATHLANTLRPKIRFASVIGSYGWGTRAVEQIAQLIPNLGVELLRPVLTKGVPTQATVDELGVLADEIVLRHREINVIPS